MPTYTQIAASGAMALLIGLLIGLERQHSQTGDEPLYAGVRTFPVVALIGYVSGLLTRAGHIWVLPMALAGVSGIIVTAYAHKLRGTHKGSTTEFVGILTFILGALAALDYMVPAATFAVVTTLLLSFKAPLHRLAERLREEELYAILKFGTVTAIVLPLLPNRAFGPFQVLNPRLIWWMVVLISALSMVGYVLMHLLGVRHGVAIAGFLGGLVSSTAATVGLSKDAREAESSLARYFVLGIVLACTIMFLRVLLLVAVINRELGGALLLPIILPFAVGIVSAAFLWKRPREDAEVTIRIKNPMELGSAIEFALLFALILFMSRAADYYFGSSGVYATAVVAGLADVDAFTVSAANLARENILTQATAASSILLAGTANTAVKAAIAMVMGGRTLRPAILPIFLALFLASVAACVLAARG
jgi:uncharacterized membrane protein (DUF4010 family)